MNKKAVLHIPMSQYAFALDEERMVFRLRTARGDMDACRLYYGDRSCRQTPVIFDSVLMKVAAQDELFDYYETEFVSPYRRLCYYFELTAGEERFLYYGDFSPIIVWMTARNITSFPICTGMILSGLPNGCRMRWFTIFSGQLCFRERVYQQ